LEDYYNHVKRKYISKKSMGCEKLYSLDYEIHSNDDLIFVLFDSKNVIFKFEDKKDKGDTLVISR